MIPEVALKDGTIRKINEIPDDRLLSLSAYVDETLEELNALLEEADMVGGSFSGEQANFDSDRYAEAVQDDIERFNTAKQSITLEITRRGLTHGRSSENITPR